MPVEFYEDQEVENNTAEPDPNAITIRITAGSPDTPRETLRSDAPITPGTPVEQMAAAMAREPGPLSEFRQPQPVFHTTDEEPEEDEYYSVDDEEEENDDEDEGCDPEEWNQEENHNTEEAVCAGCGMVHGDNGERWSPGENPALPRQPEERKQCNCKMCKSLGVQSHNVSREGRFSIPTFRYERIYSSRTRYMCGSCGHMGNSSRCEQCNGSCSATADALNNRLLAIR